MSDIEPGDQLEPPLRGYLIIYVDGYKYHLKNTVHLFSHEGQLVAVPDSVLPPPQHEIGSDEWWEDGWAIGDNHRGRLCKRFGSFKCRKFTNYDEAVAFAYRRQQKFKKQQHTLVYVTRGIGNREKYFVVHSKDQIDAIESQLALEIAENDRLQAEQSERFNAEYPHLNLLRERYGRSMAWTLSDLLNDLQNKGVEVVKNSRPKSTLLRQMKMLREAGLISEPSAESGT